MILYIHFALKHYAGNYHIHTLTFEMTDAQQGKMAVNMIFAAIDNGDEAALLDVKNGNAVISLDCFLAAEVKSE